MCGADISLTATGIASSHGWTEIVGHNGITKLPLPGRVDALDRLAWSIYDLTKSADLVCVEQLTFSRETGGHGGAGERAGLYWLLIRLYQRHDVPVVDVPTATVKRYATGKGGAVKGAVIDAAARRWPAWETGGDDNRADAVVLMAAGRDALGHPLAAMPKPHRAALDAVTWPEVS